LQSTFGKKIFCRAMNKLHWAKHTTLTNLANLSTAKRHLKLFWIFYSIKSISVVFINTKLHGDSCKNFDKASGQLLRMRFIRLFRQWYFASQCLANIIMLSVESLIYIGAGFLSWLKPYYIHNKLKIFVWCANVRQ